VDGIGLPTFSAVVEAAAANHARPNDDWTVGGG